MPRVGDADQLTLAIGTRLYDDAGREKAAFRLGQIHYFKDRRVTLQGAPTLDELVPHSALTGEASYQLAERWRASSYVEWNTSTERADVGSVQLNYQSDANHLVNLAWRYREMPPPRYVNGFDTRIDQSDISAVWPLKGNWNLVGRWDYDYSNKRTLEGILGFEYGTCCWRVRLVARSWIDSQSLLYGVKDNNTGVFVQFELKGLGSLLGGNVNGILNNGISGFRDRNNDRNNAGIGNF
ncbi:MAG TPA: LPS assembly protein LptD [Candidatus Acidoferrum sp.]|nr:LPS assembly protein LptD [Candidatus Acidoferrum sp.]